MAASASLISTALTAVKASAEYAAFQTALLALSAAGENELQARWNAAYSDGQPGLSPAHALRKAARAAVANAQATLGETLSQADSEAAYQLLAAQLCPDPVPPAPVSPVPAAFTPEDLDLFRLAAAKLAGD